MGEENGGAGNATPGWVEIENDVGITYGVEGVEKEVGAV